MRLVRDLEFDNIDSTGTKDKFCKESVFQIFPDFHGDKRGYFMEVMKNHGEHWLQNFGWMQQINRSSSRSNVLRGCHAQMGGRCQGKLVEAVNRTIFDIITDARPDSSSFGVTSVYRLDPKVHNQLWIPRGFLHAFVVPSCDGEETGEAVFQYYVDNAYSKESEICINPLSFLGSVMFKHREICKISGINDFDGLHDLFDDINSLIISNKDSNGKDFYIFMKHLSDEYAKNGMRWYV